MPSFNATWRRACAVLALASSLSVVSLSACRSNVEEKIALARLAQNCLVNTDCASPLVCAFEACHAECESSRDCEDGARCVAAARPYKVCQLEEERACEQTSDCAEGLVCGVDGECRDQCLGNTDCVEGQVCVSGTCADTTELDDSGALEPAPGKIHGAEGSPCVYVSDCSAALLCRNQACLPQCKADRDCPAREVCKKTRCEPDGTEPQACSYNSDCKTASGERCQGGACRCACVEDRDCPSGQRCNGCGCEVAPDAPPACVYNSDCEAAGQICKSRVCSCECKADSDCAKGATCDGCGCQPQTNALDGLVSGNVTIESSLQLPAYRGVTEIHGDLYITGSAIAELGDTFDELTYVGGRVMVSDNQQLTQLAFPKLLRAQIVTLSNASKLTSVAFPLLESASLELNSCPKLVSLSLPALKSGSLQSYGLSQLKELELPLVEELNYLQVSDAPLLQRVDLPKLTKVNGGVVFSSGPPNALSELSAPLLAVIGDGMSSSYVTFDNTLLTSLSDFGAAGWLINAQALTITRNSSLSSCAVDAFLARFEAGGFKQSQTISENLACVDCQGDVCADVP